MKLFYTHYALTKGIIEVEVTDWPIGDGLVRISQYKRIGKIGSDLFEDFEDARYQAENLRQQMIKTHSNQIERLEKLKFIDEEAE